MGTNTRITAHTPARTLDHARAAITDRLLTGEWLDGGVMPIAIDNIGNQSAFARRNACELSVEETRPTVPRPRAHQHHRDLRRT
ncbi:MAG: hypothetical protein U0165_01190 [Polyangiaceae bacterium]